MAKKKAAAKRRGLGRLQRPAEASPVERAAGVQAGRVKRGERRGRNAVAIQMLPRSSVECTTYVPSQARVARRSPSSTAVSAARAASLVSA